ncbi:hypothetical protein ABE452_31215, partial [Paenibacillus ferrarius]
VKADALSVDKVKAGNTGVQSINAEGANAWDTMDLVVTDNYGVEYEKQDAAHFNYLLGVSFSTSNVIGSVTVDADGTIHAAAGTTFDLIATSATGKTAVTPVKVNAN